MILETIFFSTGKLRTCGIMNTFVPPKKSKTGGHHTFDVRDLGIYKHFPLCVQRIGFFPEGTICVVFLGLRRKGEAGHPRLTQAQETVFCVHPKCSSSVVQHSPGAQSHPGCC